MARGRVNETEPGHQRQPRPEKRPAPGGKPSGQGSGPRAFQLEAARQRAREWSGKVAAVLPRGMRGPAGGGRAWWRWVAAGVLVVVLLAGAGAALYKLDHAPEEVAAQFCSAVSSGHYDQAYALLDTPLRARYSRQAFAQMGAALDGAEGRVLACGEAGNGGFDHRLGSGEATVTAHVTRSQGETFSGHVRLVDDGGWKVAALDTALVGVNLSALDTVERLCAALVADDRVAAYALAADSAGLGTQRDFMAKMDTWAQVDGKVTGCALAGVTRGPGANSDAAAQVTVAVARVRRGAWAAGLTLAAQPQGWRISRIGADLLGSDLGPLALARQLCADLAAGAYADAYGLFASSYHATVSADQFASSFAALGGTWSCAPKLETYHVAGDAGTLDVVLSLTGGGSPLAMTETLAFVRESAGWRIASATPRAG